MRGGESKSVSLHPKLSAGFHQSWTFGARASLKRMDNRENEGRVFCWLGVRGRSSKSGRTRLRALGAWQFWALLSATFAALTAIFAKVGIEKVNSDFATFFRTVVVMAALAGIVSATGQWQPFSSLSRRTIAFLVLSGLATGASWLCYFRALKLGEAARVAPIDKLSVVLVAFFGVVFLGERLTALNAIGIAMIALGAILVAMGA